MLTGYTVVKHMDTFASQKRPLIVHLFDTTVVVWQKWEVEFFHQRSSAGKYWKLFWATSQRLMHSESSSGARNRATSDFKLTLFIHRQLNTDRHIIHGNLLISIAISQTIFLVGIGQTHNKVCKQLQYFDNFIIQ